MKTSLVTKQRGKADNAENFRSYLRVDPW